MQHLALNNELMQKKEGFYQLEKDQDAMRVFEQEVAQRRFPFASPWERLCWLIDHDYYLDFKDWYSPEVLQSLIEWTHSFPFAFQSYMAMTKFYQSYALKTNDGMYYLETYPERVMAVGLYLAQGDVTLAQSLIQGMLQWGYQPATPTFLNAGRKRTGELVSCFLLEMDDSLNSINYVLNTCSQLSKIGGGVAVNLSKLRARNEAIKGVENASSGVLPVMKLMEDTFSYVNQLGQRPGAGAAYLNVFHWDVEEFLDTKKINASEKSRIQTLAIGLIVPNRFIELAKANKPCYVFAPHTVYQAIGQSLDDLDFDVWYDRLVTHPQIKKRPLDARKLLTHVAKMQFESGYPYMVFKDNANQQHALSALGSIKMSNLCTEIFQLQETSTIEDFGTPSHIRKDVSCNLGSLNIATVMSMDCLRDAVHLGMRALTQVSDLSQIANAPGVALANQQLHAVGLGVMNLHGYFAQVGIRYESDEAKEFARAFFMAMNYYSLEASCQLAQERQQTFEGFERSDYATGTYVSRYLQTDYRPTTPKIVELFANIPLPSPTDWAQLDQHIRQYGLYHAYRLAIAPTQSIGYIQNATPSVAPIVDLVERRTYGDSTTYYPMPFLSPQNVFYYKSAFHMDMMKVIDLIAEIQPHIDQGISTTLYVDSNTTTRELARYYLYAHHKGLKALYYTRTKNLSFEECTTCSV